MSRKLPSDEELKAIRPLQKKIVSDYVWIEIDQTQSRDTDKGVIKGARMKFRIPRYELEAARKKYQNKNLKVL